ncbi:MAG: HAD family phosphatase [Dehalococcoidales bacterium]|nr:MAG: HAD family phosphatase [Dehalococcoidales bacterium]
MSRNSIKLVAVDLDGTLLITGNNGTSETTPLFMAPEGARMLKAAAQNGIHVIVATSRVINSVRELCRSLMIESPVICTNGAQIFETIDGALLKSITFPRETGLAIARFADTNNWELSITVGSTTCYKQRSGQELGQFAAGRMIVATNSDAVTNDVTRILVHDPEAIRGIMTFCESMFPEECRIERYTGPDAMSLGIFGKHADKGNALDFVLKRLGINQSEVMAIGDDLNDLSLFSRAQIKVAMGNAHPELIEQATTVAPTNEDEGVAWALQEYGISLPT